MEITSVIPRRRGLHPWARDTAILHPRPSRRASSVICCGAGRDGGDGGDGGDGSLSEDHDDQHQDDSGTEGDSSPPPTFSFAAVEEELKSRSIAKATTLGEDAGNEGGTTAEQDDVFPPTATTQLPGGRQDDEGEGGGVVQPLIELPIDGVLLQLFPALLIAVVGLFLTIAVQVEAGRFDGMVGDDGGAVVVTDLRDTP